MVTGRTVGGLAVAVYAGEMGEFAQWFELLRTMDDNLGRVIREYGGLVYVLLGVATFAKSGLIYFPALPTTTLLFAAGAVASPAVGGLQLVPLLFLLWGCAWLGDLANYGWGRLLGRRLAEGKGGRWFRVAWIARAEAAFEKYGFNVILLARWVSVLRSTVPFVAGSSRFSFVRFAGLNLVSCGLWVFVVVLSGYFFGSIPWVRENLVFLTLLILLVLAGPLVYRLVQDRRAGRSAAAGETT